MSTVVQKSKPSIFGHNCIKYCFWFSTFFTITVTLAIKWPLNIRDVHEAFLVETEARPKPWSPRPRPRPRCWQFKPRQDRDQGLQSSRPRRGRGVPTPRRYQAEALLRLETASRPRCQDRGTSLLNIPPNLKCTTTQPCKTLQGVLWVETYTW